MKRFEIGKTYNYSFGCTTAKYEAKLIKRTETFGFFEMPSKEIRKIKIKSNNVQMSEYASPDSFIILASDEA